MSYAKMPDEPSIVYACISEKSTISYEFATKKGNLHTVAQEVIRKSAAQKS
jgi:hypothetical protein